MTASRGFRISLPVISLCAMGVVAEASIYVPIADSSLVDRAPIAVVGRIESWEASGRAYTAYQVSVERILKGSLSGSRIKVAVPGNETFFVSGMPRFEADQRVILFLAPHGDGAYRIVELMLGAFKGLQVRNSSESRAQRDLSGSTSVAGDQYEPGRDFESFANWIEQRAHGAVEPETYVRASAELSAPGFDREVSLFTFLGPPSRWIQFDAGASVPWVLRPGASSLAAGGASAFQAALTAYNTQPDSKFNFTYLGTNPLAQGFNASDGLNAVIMNDPFGEIPGTFACATGGVLAFGGYSTFGSHTYKGSTHRTSVEGDIVTQDGSDCYFSRFSEAAGAQVFAHEIGHVIGLGHSCGGSSAPACVAGSAQDAALMRASAHNDARGASFGTDDIAGLVRLYERTTPAPTISIDDPSQNEGNRDTTLISFTVTLSAAPTTAVSVTYTTSAGTASPLSDYLTRTGTLTFAAGQTTRHVLIPIVGDVTVEPNETLNLTLTLPVGATILDGSGVATIVNDDAPAVASPVNQYRLYSPVTLEHLYTTDLNEYNVLGTRVGTWLQEGISYKMLSSGGTFSGTLPSPFYRLYHAPSRQHHWTTDTNEVVTLAALTDWSYEGIIGFLLSNQVSGSVPLFRLAFPNTAIHLWTTDSVEKSVLTTSGGWVSEGIPGYVIP